MALVHSQEMLTAALQKEREKYKLLQEGVQNIVSHEGLEQRNETGVLTVRNQSDALQSELEKEIKSIAACEGWCVNSSRAGLDIQR